MKAKRALTAVYAAFLDRRNRQILKLRRRGMSLKNIAEKFSLTVRQISRILAGMQP